VARNKNAFPHREWERGDKAIRPAGISEDGYVIGTIMKDHTEKIMAVFSNRPFRFEKGFAPLTTLGFNLTVSHERGRRLEKSQSDRKGNFRNKVSGVSVRGIQFQVSNFQFLNVVSHEETSSFL
jgi:hypothetical protein